MTNGNGRISSRDLKMSRFLHKKRWHYSYDGRFIDCQTFHEMQEMKIGDNKIFSEFGKSFEDAAEKWQKDLDERNDYPDITNWQKLLDFMFSIMKDDVVKNIKGKLTGDMKAEDVVPLLPEPFQPIFSMRLDYDEKIKKHQGVKK